MWAQNIKAIFFSVLLVLILFFSLEVLLKIFNYPDKNIGNMKTNQILSKLDSKYSNYFCDNHHKKDAAQKALSSCINNEFSPVLKNIHTAWIFGGSASEEYECGVKTNWTQQFAQENRQIQVINYSKKTKVRLQ